MPVEFGFVPGSCGMLLQLTGRQLFSAKSPLFLCTLYVVRNLGAFVPLICFDSLLQRLANLDTLMVN